MSKVIKKPSHAHGLSEFQRLKDGHVRACCICGAWWTGPSKPAAAKALNKHLSMEARQFRKVLKALRQERAAPAIASSESGDQYVMEVECAD